jgi:hypothetical protein
MENILFKVARNGKEFTEVDEAGLRNGVKSGQIMVSDHCWSAGFGQWQRVDVVLAKLNAPKPQVQAAASPSRARSSPAILGLEQKEVGYANTGGAFIPHLWVIFIIGLLAWIASSHFYTPQWEYRTIRVLTSQQSERTGLQAMKYSSIDSDSLAAQMQALGREGWEIVGSTVEMETAWPNFGRDDYVTGLQPNIRPQSMLVILKRKRSLF